MARLPTVTREQIRPEDLPEFDETVRLRGGIRSGYLNLLYSPKLAALVNSLDQFFPLESVMGAGLGSTEEKWETRRRTGRWRRSKLMAVAILATAREIGCQFLFTGHSTLARRKGVSEETIRAIEQGTARQGLSGDEELLVRFTQELLRERKISDATLNGVKDRFGVRWTVELAGIICYYVMAGHLAMAFEVEPSDGAPGAWPS